METEASQTLQTILPIWVVLPGLIAIWIVTQWPRIRDVLRDMIPSQRAFYREKQRLELLKLKYEIEVLRQTNNLENIEESTHGGEAAATSEGRQEGAGLPTPVSEPPSEPFSLLDAGRRVGLGALGGFLVQIYTIVAKAEYSAFVAVNRSLEMYLSWYIAPLFLVVVLTFLSGIAAYVLTDRDTTGFRCFALGAIVLVVLFGLIPVSEPTQIPQLTPGSGLG